MPSPSIAGIPWSKLSFSESFNCWSAMQGGCHLFRTWVHLHLSITIAFGNPIAPNSLEQGHLCIALNVRTLHWFNSRRTALILRLVSSLCGDC